MDSEFFTSVIVAALWIGIISGCIPLIYGLSRGQLGLAIGGFFACVVSGFIGGAIMAFPIAGVFFYLINKGSKSAGNG